MDIANNLTNSFDKYELFKIDSREDYLRLLDVLEKHTAVIEYAQSAGENPDDPLVKTALRFVRSKYLSTEWAAVGYGGPGMIYKFRADKAIFKRLREYESFLYNGKDRCGHTDFGRDNDIAFFDKNEDLLFCTLTHEFDAFILSDLLRELNNKQRGDSPDSRIALK